MAEAGVFAPDERVELIEGEMVRISPFGSRHAAVLSRLSRFFSRLPVDLVEVRTQQPLHIDDLSEPEPDVALVKPRADNYAAAHPTPPDAMLIIEVADTTLAFDKTTKAQLYAGAGIPVYWIVDLKAERVLAFTRPHDGMYRQQEIVAADGDPPLPFAAEIQLDLAEILR